MSAAAGKSVAADGVSIAAGGVSVTGAGAGVGAGVSLDGDARLAPRLGGMRIRLTVADRERVLDAMRALVVVRGYGGVLCREVAARAGMANNKFYELFAGKEDCFLALFERELAALERVVRPAYEAQAQKGWVDRVRGGLGALLGYLDGDPQVANVVFGQSLAAGPRVLARRREVLDGLAAVVDEGRFDSRGRERARQPSELTAQGVVGGVCGLIYSHAVCGGGDERRSLVELLPGLMANVVLPYRGRAAAKKELQTFDGRADQGRRERGVLPKPKDTSRPRFGQRASEDADRSTSEMRSSILRRRAAGV